MRGRPEKCFRPDKTRSENADGRWLALHRAEETGLPASLVPGRSFARWSRGDVQKREASASGA